jgi:hypothetical protein
LVCLFAKPCREPALTGRWRTAPLREDSSSRPYRRPPRPPRQARSLGSALECGHPVSRGVANRTPAVCPQERRVGRRAER